MPFIRCNLCYRRLKVNEDSTESSVLENHKVLDCVVAAKHPDYKPGTKKRTIEKHPIDMTGF